MESNADAPALRKCPKCLQEPWDGAPMLRIWVQGEGADLWCLQCVMRFFRINITMGDDWGR